jgi:hypothetical protein
MKLTLLLLLSLFSFSVGAQTSYSGSIGPYPIQLVTYLYSDGDARALYAYDKFDTPIRINGKKVGSRLELYERNEQNVVTATLRFENFNPKSSTISGTWVNKDGSKKLNITLNKQFDAEGATDFNQKELLQAEATQTQYFKLLITKSQGDVRVTGVKVLEKKTDRLIQQIDLDCQLMGLDNVSTGDFNFDGLEDFSVFEASYAGPNTSSIYILRLPGLEKYVVSSFTGTSLEFDAATKTIHEHNQCCAGRSHVNATYKVVNNKMVLIEKTCLEYDEEKDDFTEVKCDEN